MCKRILIVEDDKDSALLFQRFIGRHFYLDVDIVETVDFALKAIEQIEYACVITDISLPVKSGHHLIRHLLDRKIPVIAATAYMPNLNYIDPRVKAVFYKPINWDNFTATLKELLKVQDVKELVEIN